MENQANGRYLDAHVQMSARTTEDYRAMRAAGVAAVVEPASSVGQPRTHWEALQHHFKSLLGWERLRAGRFGIRHYCALGLTPREANNESLVEAAMERLPIYACKEGVVAIGEIGLEEQTPLEERCFRTQLELARQLDMPVLIRVPQWDKTRAAMRSMALCVEHGIEPQRVMFCGVDEATMRPLLDHGCWVACSINPRTGMDSERAAVAVERNGSERVMFSSAADWDESDPLAVAKTAHAMRQRGVSNEAIEAVCYHNAVAFYSQSGRLAERDWRDPPSAERRELLWGEAVGECPEDTRFPGRPAAG